MAETRYCLNCAWTMNTDGCCTICGSDSLVLLEASKPFELGRVESVMECRRIFALEYEPDYRDEEGYTDSPTELAQWWNKI